MTSSTRSAKVLAAARTIVNDLGRVHHEPTAIRTLEPGAHGNRPLTR